MHALRKGLATTSDGKHLYFPPGLVTGDRLRYVTYDGRQTFVNAVGERTFRVGPLGKNREKTRYHLSPTFRPSLWKYQQPVVQVQMRLYLTDVNGSPLDSRKANRRRKAIGKNWWNAEWLVCITGENVQAFRREAYTQNGRRRTAKTVENVQRFRLMTYTCFG